MKMGDEPPYLAVGTEVSAKYKGAFCEAKIRKVVRSVKCKVIFKQGLGPITVADDQIKGQIRNGATVEVKHPDRKEMLEATIAKVQDCSQYTVVFDDGDITTLRRTALCLKSGRHFAESETLDQLPLTHPEHFSNPVIGGRRGRRNRAGPEESSEDEEAFLHLKDFTDEKEEDIGRVVCVEGAEKKKQKDNWFPGLVVAPTAQDTVPIDVRLEYLVRSFKDGRYYTVPKKEALEFTREIGLRVENSALKAAVEKALQFLDKDELPPHWDRDLLFGLNEIPGTDSETGLDYESSDDEPREEKDHFVAQLYKFMDDSGTPINKGPTICNQDVDLYKLFKVVQNLGGFNRVTNQNNWKIVSSKMGFGHNPATVNVVKQSYKKFLYSFEEFYRKLGCTMVNHPRTSRTRNRSTRTLIRDRDRAIKQEIKTEPKDKPDEVISAVPPILPENIKIKVEVEEPTNDVVEPLTFNTREKLSNKKNQDNIEEIKIKQEPVDTFVEPKGSKKTRQKKIKNAIVDQINIKSEPLKESNSPKDKKRRLFTRSKKEKEKTLTVKKSNTASVTRQKRTMKEKMKAIVDQLKLRTSKFAQSALGLHDSAEKPCHSAKKKVMEEHSVPRIKKEDQSASVSTIDDKKKGRRRKEKSEIIDEGAQPVVCFKRVSIGDKLKVYYGPKHDLKVTYEAKVLNIRQDGSETIYLVHYYGWNTRYDEWIKQSRIADNMSAGRPTKKSQQAARGGRKRNSQSRTGNDSAMKSDIEIIDISDHSNDVKQENITPFTSPIRFKWTRSSTRSSNKRVPSVSENEEYESDNIDIENNSYTKKKSSDVQDVEIIQSEKRGRKRKSIESEGKDKSGDEYDLIKSPKPRRKSNKKAECTQEIIKPCPENKKSEDNKNGFAKMENIRSDATPGTEGTPKKFEGFDESSDEEEFNLYIDEDEIDMENKKEAPEDVEKLQPPQGRDFDLNEIRSELKGIETAVGSSVTTIAEEEEMEEAEEEEEEEAEEEEEEEEDEEDGEDNEEEEEEEEEAEQREMPRINSNFIPKVETITIKQEVEDVYEFKEPEPFEFESRKIDDKNQLLRRSLNRYIDENKLSPQRKRPKICVSPTFNSKKIILIPDEPNITIKKEDESPDEEFSTVEACEAEFDKICASSLRTINSESVPLFEEQIVNDHVEDNLDDDSQDRLVISERYSDNESNSSEVQKVEVIEEDIKTITVVGIKPSLSQTYNSNKDEVVEEEEEEQDEEEHQESEEQEGEEQEVEEPQEQEQEDEEQEEETRDNFNKEEWKDEVEDEELNVAIQRVINQDSSDESNDEEDKSKPRKAFGTLNERFKYQFDFHLKHTVETENKDNDCEEAGDKSNDEIETEVIEAPSNYDECPDSPNKMETDDSEEKEESSESKEGECIEEDIEEEEEEITELEMEGAAEGLDVTEIVADETGEIEENEMEEPESTVVTAVVEEREDLEEADEGEEAEEAEEAEEEGEEAEDGEEAEECEDAEDGEEAEDEEEEEEEDDDLEEVGKQEDFDLQYNEKAETQEQSSPEKMTPLKTDEEEEDEEEQEEEDEEEDEVDDAEEEKLEEEERVEDEEEERVEDEEEEKEDDEKEVTNKENEIEDKDDNDENVVSVAVKDEEEDEEEEEEEEEEDEEEENLMSLLCDEEIIPGSPNPQGDDVQEEHDKNMLVIADIDNDDEIPLSQKLKDTHSNNDSEKDNAPEENSPPASPRSSGSSMSSPLQERDSVSPPVLQGRRANRVNSEKQFRFSDPVETRDRDSVSPPILPGRRVNRVTSEKQFRFSDHVETRERDSVSPPILAGRRAHRVNSEKQFKFSDQVETRERDSVSPPILPGRRINRVDSEKQFRFSEHVETRDRDCVSPPVVPLKPRQAFISKKQFPYAEQVETESHKSSTDDSTRIRIETRLKKPEGRASVKKGRRPRKRSQEAGKRKYSRSSRHHGSDSDDNYDNPRVSTSRESLHRPSRSGKYNFALKLGPELDSNQRIALITQTIQQLRRSYADVKTELAAIDRRRKKLRRRERENASARFH